MELGIITGRTIEKNRDGDKDRIILQVEIIADDVRPVELISQAGEDTNPANGCRVLVSETDKSYSVGVAVTDDLAPEVDAGEKEIYSTDSPATQKLARLKFNKNSELIVNEGTKSAVSHAELNTALQSLVTAINAVLATKFDAGGTPGTLTLDISTSEVTKVKLP